MEESLTMPDFDPAIHLAFQPPSARHSFTSIGLSPPKNTPDMCYTEPFQLFSAEGIRMIRRDLFQKKLLDRHLKSWERAPCFISGHDKDPEVATFIKQAWHHPSTIAAISEAAGVLVKPLTRESDVGFVNIQLGSQGRDGVYLLSEDPSAPLPPSSESLEQSKYDEIPIDAWHKDMTPLVCVLMLSDTSNMEGGETAIRTGDGSIVKVRGAQMGGAVVMQGGATEHAALRATNCIERVSMAAGFYFEDPTLDDSRTTLRSLDPDNDDVPRMLRDHWIHKLSRAKDMIDAELSRVEELKEGELLRRSDVEPWVIEQTGYFKSAAWELFERNPKWLGRDVPDTILRSYLGDSQTTP